MVEKVGEAEVQICQNLGQIRGDCRDDHVYDESLRLGSIDGKN